MFLHFCTTLLLQSLGAYQESWVSRRTRLLFGRALGVIGDRNRSSTGKKFRKSGHLRQGLGLLLFFVFSYQAHNISTLYATHVCLLVLWRF